MTRRMPSPLPRRQIQIPLIVTQFTQILTYSRAGRTAGTTVVVSRAFIVSTIMYEFLWSGGWWCDRIDLDVESFSAKYKKVKIHRNQ